MQNVTDRLAGLGGTAVAEQGDDVVAADLRRGRQALRRRHLGTAGLGVATVAVAVVATAVALTHTSPAPAAKPEAHSRAHSATPTSTVASSTGATPVASPALELVAYHGEQKPGFTVKSVPAGYVLQGVSGSTLDIAKKGDHSSLDNFQRKLTVGIEENANGQGLSVHHGKKVTVHGRPGILQVDGGIAQLVFKQGHGSHNVVIVQKWSNIHLTQHQLLKFAAGITVTGSAQRQHG